MCVRAVDKGGDKLFQSTCTVVPQCDRVILEHQCDDAPGMSGGPLFERSDEVVRAVLLGALDETTNTAVLLTKEIVAYINEVVDSLDKLARQG
jgi:V8-like Glu-specific endopeptidase